MLHALENFAAGILIWRYLGLVNPPSKATAATANWRPGTVSGERGADWLVPVSRTFWADTHLPAYERQSVAER
jgi:hypothetical protein